MEEVAIPCSELRSLLTLIDFIDPHLPLSGLGQTINVVTPVVRSGNRSANCCCCAVVLSSAS